MAHGGHDHYWRRNVAVRKNYKYYLAVSIALVTFLVYLTALQNAYVNWDDEAYVFENPYIRTFNVTFFKWAFLNFYLSNWHPLTWVSHALDYALWGLNPLGHHLTSIILHAANTFLVALLILKLLEARKAGTTPNEAPSFLAERPILIAAGVTGLLFGLHPLHVESAAWIAERKDLLCALFFLLSIIVYAKYISGQQSKGNGNEETGRKNFLINRHYLIALVLFILALLSKPMAVTLPVVLLILDWYPFTRIRSWKTFWAAGIEKLPFIALSLFSSILTVLAQRDALQSTEFAPVSTRLLVGAKSLIAYLLKMVWPLNLVPYYPYPRNMSLFSFQNLSAVVLVIGITLVCAVMARKQKLLLSVWGYYVVTLIPVLGIVQVGHQEMADRYTYLPSIGPFLLAGLGAAWGSAKSHKSGNWPAAARTLVLAGSIFIFACLPYVTIEQIGIWKNSIALWNYVIKMEPDRVPEAYYNRGLAFDKMGQLDRALADYDKAISLNPYFWGPSINRGLIYYKIGQLDRAVADFDHVISLNPAHAGAYYNRGLVFDKMGRLDKALADYDRAISLSPYDADAYNNRGLVFYKIGQLDRAIADFDHAIFLNPAYSEAYYSRGLAFQESGQPDKANRDFMAWKAYSAER